MLTMQGQRDILDFVEKNAVLARSDEEEDTDYYFSARFGRVVNKAKSELPGVYVSRHKDVEDLKKAVQKNIRDSITSRGDATNPSDLLFLAFMKKGENNPEDVQPARLEHDYTMALRDDPSVRVERARGPDAFPTGAALVMMDTHKLLAGLLTDSYDRYERLQEAKLDSDVRGMQLLSENIAAQAMVKVAEEETQVRKIDRMFARLDPHIEALGPDVLKVLQTTAEGFANQWSPSSEGPPKDAGEALDWHIERLDGAMKGLGFHLVKNPDSLTEARQERLEKLIAMAMKVAAEFG